MAAAKKGYEDVYISFHNEDKTAFHLAQNRLNTTNLPKGFMIVPGLTREAPSTGSSKLHWDKLNRSVKGIRSPHENKGWITRRFNDLAKMGWEVEDKAE